VNSLAFSFVTATSWSYKPLAIFITRYATLLTVLTACAWLAGTAHGAQTATITTAFRPLRLGAPTTVSLGFDITARAVRVPSPLVGVEFHYPPNLGIATSDLGSASCAVAEVEAHGPSICPPNSVMGRGSALVRIPVGGEVESELAAITLIAGPSPDGNVRLLVTAVGESPVIARIVMPSTLRAGNLQLTVPLVESLPEAPDVSVVRVRAVLGGNLTYRERRKGRTIFYRPKGVILPRTCPHGGFRFSARFRFQDGTEAEARSRVACPGGRG
jgi:hypothetical protein